MTQDPNPIIDPLPGCKGHCLQGYRPCLSPEECWPDEPFAIRHPYLTGFGLFLLIVLLVEFLALLVWWFL